MNTDILISVLIPAYNTSKYLSQCLDSIVNQTHKRLQVVVVDDGSTDNTLDIATRYAEQYPFIEVYHQANAGVATARNTLISHCKGDYILFVDSDDWIEHDMVERMLYTIVEQKSDIAVCGCMKESGESSTAMPLVHELCSQEGQENVVRELLIHQRLNGSLCNKLVARRFYEGLTFQKDIWYGEDCLFLWQAINRGVEKICFMPNCLYHYRMNEQSISHERFNFKKLSGHEVWKQINIEVDKKWPNVSHIAKGRFVQQDIMLLYYAAKANYKGHKQLNEIRKNIKQNIQYFKQADMSTPQRLLLGYSLSYAYSLTSKFIRAFL